MSGFTNKGVYRVHKGFMICGSIIRGLRGFVGFIRFTGESEGSLNTRVLLMELRAPNRSLLSAKRPISERLRRFRIPAYFRGNSTLKFHPKP